MFLEIKRKFNYRKSRKYSGDSLIEEGGTRITSTIARDAEELD